MKLNLNRNKRYAIPIMTHPGIELIEKTVKAAVTDGQTHADAIIALSENTPSDAATVIMDLTVEAEAFGAKLHFSENDVPSVAERLLHDRNEVENLRIPNTDTARIPEYLKANRLAAERINDRPVFAGCIGPYSLAGRLYDMSEIDDGYLRRARFSKNTTLKMFSVYSQIHSCSERNRSRWYHHGRACRRVTQQRRCHNILD